MTSDVHDTLRARRQPAEADPSGQVSAGRTLAVSELIGASRECAGEGVRELGGPMLATRLPGLAGGPIRTACGVIGR